MNTELNNELSLSPTNTSQVPLVTSEPATVARKGDSTTREVDSYQVLVVDDQQVTRMRLQHLLTNAGFNVLMAVDGREAVEIVRTQTIDLVLMDISMPVMSGLMATRMMRQLYDRSSMPIMLMTATGGREQVLEAFSAGANDYINKPIDNEILLARTNNQLLIRKAQKKLQESEERYALASQGTNDGIWDWNLQTGEVYLSPRWREMLGIEDNVQLGENWMDLIHVEDRNRVTAMLEIHLCGESDYFETELRMQDCKGSYRWMLCRGLAVHDESGLAYRIAGSLTDITVGKVADPLTGLPNRVLFQDRVERAVEQLKRRPDQKFGVIYLDVDDFKLINDHLGHRAGDEFLVEVAQRIETAIRKSESFVARLGGDEFAVVVQAIDSVADVIRVAERIHEKMNVPFRVGNREILTRASMGISIAAGSSNPTGAEPLTAELLVSQADAAMYFAKKQSHSPFCVFERHMLDENTMVLETGHDLKMAIRRRELTVKYQPIIDTQTHETIGFESLLRWYRPAHGEVLPSFFIPIAEANGLIVEIGEWVLRESCKQIQAWNREHGTKLIISVNVSIRQIAKGDFLPIVKRVLKETRLPPQLLRLEVTETVLMQNTEETIRLLAELQDTGIQIAIDDFGTGYSSLSYLYKMPVDVLKVDQSFVNKMADSDKHFAIVKTIIMLANSLNLELIAEGIETGAQLKALQSLGCRKVQGHLFSQAVEHAEAESLIGKRWQVENMDR